MEKMEKPQSWSPRCFIDLFAWFLFGCNQLEQVTAVCKLHHDAQTASLVLEEGFFVADNIRMADWCQYSNFIKCILFLFTGQFLHFDLFHCVNFFVRSSLYLKHVTKRALTCSCVSRKSIFLTEFAQYREVLHCCHELSVRLLIF